LGDLSELSDESLSSELESDEDSSEDSEFHALFSEASSADAAFLFEGEEAQPASETAKNRANSRDTGPS
jgi:hypothetical protein